MSVTLKYFWMKWLAACIAAAVSVSAMAGVSIVSLQVDYVKQLSFSSSSVSKAYGDAAFNLNATSISPGAVSYSSSVPTIASVDNTGTVTITGIGDTTITATQSAAGNYPSATASYILSVAAGSPSLTFTSASVSKVYGDAAFTNPLSSNSSGTITYGSSAPTVASVDGAGKVTPLAVGTATIIANQAATATYQAKTATYTVSVSAAAPTLSGFTIPGKISNDVPFALTAPASNSGGVFTYSSSNPAVATVSGNTVTIVGAGSSIITATQSGAGNYSTGSIKATLNVTQANSVPTAFRFVDQTGVATGSVIESAPITVSGINTASPISIAGGDYAISSNGGAAWGSWKSVAGTILNGNLVKVRGSSSGAYSSHTAVTLNVGGISDAFDITTTAPPAVDASTTNLAPTVSSITATSFQATNRIADGDGVSNIQFFLFAADGVTATGNATGLNSGLFTGLTTNTTYVAKSSATVTNGATGGTSTVTSDGASVTTLNTAPNAFNIPNMINQARSTAVTTNSIAVSGITTSVTASTTVGIIVKNGADTGSNSASVVAGDTVAVKLTTSASYSTAVNGTLTVGTGANNSDSFSVTTHANTAPSMTGYADFAATSGQDSAEQSITVSDSEGGNVTVTGSSDDPQCTITFTTSQTVAAGGVVKYRISTPPGYPGGLSTLTFTATDDGGLTSEAFVNLTIN